jgi:hypothetical protein
MWGAMGNQQIAKSEYALARERVEEAVLQHIVTWAAAINLMPADAGFVQFREHVAESLHASMRAHIATPYRWRWSRIRKEFEDLADDYSTIAKLLRRWQSGGVLPVIRVDRRFEDLPQLWAGPTRLRAVLTEYGDAARFTDLAKAARRHAERCAVDKGGRSPPYVFDTLCFGHSGVSAGLRGAVEGAGGRKVTITWHDDRGEWGGDFFQLVEAVWPVACEIAEAVTKRRVPPNPSTPEARGKHLQRLLERYNDG